MKDVTPSKDIQSVIKFCVSANMMPVVTVHIKRNNTCTAQFSIQKSLNQVPLKSVISKILAKQISNQ